MLILGANYIELNKWLKKFLCFFRMESGYGILR